MAKAGGYPTSVAGPRYDFTKFKGKTKPQGVFLSRNKFPYQKTSEYKRRVAAVNRPIRLARLGARLCAAVNRALVGCD